ncbi:MAG: class I SAM-dependent methyltransferase [Solirubrobacteraceae bacterium]
MSAIEPEEQRALSREAWERAAQGWGNHAERIREWGMPVSVAMVDGLGLQPGQRVLELAAGPGDTGLMAAELVRPGGTLISSDGAEAMLAVARERAAQAGIDNVEFRQLELEWIDLETASVDAVLCRWGIMLIVDREAAAQEVRRILKPGGHAAFAVWDLPARNPWATIPSRAMIALGHSEPPDPSAPGMFRLADDGQLVELLESAGFVDVDVEPVALHREYRRAQDYIDETVDMSPLLGRLYAELDEAQQRKIAKRIIGELGDFTAADGSVSLPGSSLVAIASA